MKSVLIFYLQLLLLGCLVKFTIRMFIPRPIRALGRKAFYKSIIMTRNTIKAIHNDFEEEECDEEDNVIEFEKFKKSKAK